VHAPVSCWHVRVEVIGGLASLKVHFAVGCAWVDPVLASNESMYLGNQGSRRTTSALASTVTGAMEWAGKSGWCAIVWHGGVVRRLCS
jgi:hypothetical protein